MEMITLEKADGMAPVCHIMCVAFGLMILNNIASRMLLIIILMILLYGILFLCFSVRIFVK